LRQRVLEGDQQEELAGTLLVIRRIAIVAVVLGGYLVYRALGRSQGLAAIGLISFAAIAQLAPAFFGGLIWRGATARGAIAGIVAGFAVWSYTLLLPWVVKAGLLTGDIMQHGLLGLAMLRPQALFYLTFDPLTHGVLWSLAANIVAYVAFSLWRAPEPIERMQAHLFVRADTQRAPPVPAFRLWRTSVTVADLQATVTRYLGAERAERSFIEYAAGRGIALQPHAEADIQLLRFTEHLLASAIGAASARLVLSLLLRRSDVGSASALKLLDDASEALQYNRDLLQSALDQVRHGLGVFDRNMQLVCWNLQFRELLGLSPQFGRVGVPLSDILRTCAERGDFGPGPMEELVADRLMKLAVTKETFQEQFDGGRRILEVRVAPMPQPEGGIVCTFSDITERVEAADALARANETLEGRVRGRTSELEAANEALAIAKANADNASLDKTRFLAAASHDLMQPLNAARLYTSSLVERNLSSDNQAIARNIDASLGAVEEILSALIDISRMDAGRLEPEIADFALAELFERMEVEFAPVASRKGLKLRMLPTRQWVRSDRRLVKRVLQNLVANALKYTGRGRVLVGVRRRGDRLRIEVHDMGPGIPRSKYAAIFKEFERLETSSSEAQGLGLGLSIVERIGRLLKAPVGVSSVIGRGSMFFIALPLADAGRAAITASSRPAPTQTRLKGYTTLCVDNEPAVLAGMRALLEGWGCEVLTASGGRQALSFLEARHGKPPDALLVDYHLDEETGLDVIAAVRAASGVEVPAVIITADHSPEVQREIRDRGLVVLEKPLKAAALRAILNHYASRGRAAAE
ncbi:MAG: NahK/ErcS family hybrid sensor histidine kinase/response regulator, partial [Hyphomicrobiaceae bacterium]